MTEPTTIGIAPSERREIVEVARELGRRELLPHALELDEPRTDAVDAAWERVTDVGFDRALISVEDGGVGLDTDTLLLCLEELAAGDGGIAMLALLSNAALAVLPAEQLAEIPPGKRWALVPAPPGDLPTSARVEVEEGRGTASLSGRLCPRSARSAPTASPSSRGSRMPLSSPSHRELRRGDRVHGPAARPACGGGSLYLLLRRSSRDRAPPIRDTVSGTVADPAASRHRGDRPRRCPPGAGDGARLRRNPAAGGRPIVEHDAVREMLAAMAVRLSAARVPLAQAAGSAMVGPGGANGQAGGTMRSRLGRRDKGRDHRGGRGHDHGCGTGLRRGRLHARDRHREADAGREGPAALARAELGREQDGRGGPEPARSFLVRGTPAPAAGE